MKSQIYPFFFTILGQDFVARRTFGNTHAVIPTSEWEGGGAGFVITKIIGSRPSKEICIIYILNERVVLRTTL